MLLYCIYILLFIAFKGYIREFDGYVYVMSAWEVV